MTQHKQHEILSQMIADTSLEVEYRAPASAWVKVCIENVLKDEGDSEFRIKVDRYAHLRKANEEGRVVFFNDESGIWILPEARGRVKWAFTLPPDRYKIV